MQLALNRFGVVGSSFERDFERVIGGYSRVEAKINESRQLREAIEEAEEETA